MDITDSEIKEVLLSWLEEHNYSPNSLDFSRIPLHIKGAYKAKVLGYAPASGKINDNGILDIQVGIFNDEINKDVLEIRSISLEHP